MGTHDFYADVTDFIFLSDPPERADVILLPGASKADHTRCAAKLYHAGFAPYILPSGLHGKALSRFGDGTYPSEWAYMRSILLDLGVKDESILKEDQATFTWENAKFSHQALDAAGLSVQTAILCCRPFHARRAFTYYQAAFPDTRILVCPAKEPGLDRGDWFLTPEGRDRVFSELVKCGSQVRPQAEMLLKEEQNHADNQGR